MLYPLVDRQNRNETGTAQPTVIEQPLQADQGLGVAVMSYCDKVSFGLIADWDLVPDLGSFGRALVASFQELRDASERADVNGG